MAMLSPFTCNMLSNLAIFACSIHADAQGLCMSNSKVSNLAIGSVSRDSNIHKVILCTPKLTSLTVKGTTTPAFPAPSTCNLTLLEELKFDCTHVKFTTGDNILISLLHLLATVERMTLSVSFLKSMVNVLKNNGLTGAQLPSFVKLKSLKVECYLSTWDESVREMVTYLLQSSRPPPTFVISNEIDQTLDRCFILQYLFPIPMVNKTCEKCGHGEASFYTRQARSADEGQVTCYVCINPCCRHHFKDERRITYFI